MGFQIIEHNVRSGYNTGTGVAIGTNHSGKSIKARIRFAPDVLQVMGWTVGVKLQLAYGDGENAGQLRILPNELSGYKLRSGSPDDRSHSIYCPYIGDGIKHKSENAEYEIEDGALYVELPAWARVKSAEAA